MEWYCGDSSSVGRTILWNSIVEIALSVRFHSCAVTFKKTRRKDNIEVKLYVK